MTLPLTVIVLAKDEELNIPACLASVANVSDDVHVLDSGSADRTVEIARSHGAQVHEHPFASFGQQRNWAIDHIPHKYPWAFHLDADERFTPALAEEIGRVLAAKPAEAGYLVPSKLMLGEKWLKYSGEYPAYQVRLFHRERLRFSDAGHGQREQTEGLVGKLREPYLHYAFSKGLEDWLRKHAGYAKREAAAFREESASVLGDLQTVVAGSAIARRRTLKRLSFRLPARGFLRYFHLLVIKRGILDGRAGITHARMKAIYEEMITLYAAMDDP